MGCPVHDNTMAPATRHPPCQARCGGRSSHERQTTPIMRSRHLRASINSDAAAASVRARPTISSSGPTDPPAAMAPASQGTSAEPSGASMVASGAISGLAIRRTTAMPIPAPQYRRPARTAGSIEPRSAFAAGVEMPNSAADMKARMTAWRFMYRCYLSPGGLSWRQSIGNLDNLNGAYEPVPRAPATPPRNLFYVHGVPARGSASTTTGTGPP